MNKKDYIQIALFVFGIIIFLSIIISAAIQSDKEYEKRLYECVEKTNDLKWCYKNI